MDSYGSTVRPASEPSPAVARRPGVSAAAVASALLLFAGATLAGRAASPRADASLAAAAGALHHDDEYQPASANTTNAASSADDDAMLNATSAGGYAQTVSAQAQSGDTVDHSWADATVEIDVRKYKYVAQYLDEVGVDADAPAEVMRDYVPKLKLRYNKKRSEGTIGSQASTGWVLMSLAGPRRG